MKKISASLIACIMIVFLCFGSIIPAFAQDGSPVAENLELKTYMGVSVGGTLAAYDPEEDVASFEICTEPVKGSLKLESSGSFVYTPDEGKKGRDYFGYKAIDSQGNVSQEATVIIRIEKQKKSVSYSDMEDMPGEYAAVLLSERGIFTGEQLGGQYCFKPDSSVSRAEFLSMCMMVSGRESTDAVIRTGYADDDKIPEWLKGYIMTAAADGIALLPASGEAVFEAEKAISRAEAIQMLNDAMELYDVDYISFDNPEASALQACINLEAVGIINELPDTDTALTRQEAALMLAKAIEIIDRR